MASAVQYETFPNPALAEATCELSFASTATWDPDFFGEFFKLIQSRFPSMQPGAELGFDLQVGAGGFAQRALPPKPRVLFRHKSDPVIIQLSERSLAMNFLQPYPGWKTVKAHILWAWDQLSKATGFSELGRVGLRYINRIERLQESERASRWLRAGRFLPGAVLDSRPGYFLREEVHLTDRDLIIMTLGDTVAEEQSPFGSIVLDLDRILESRVEIVNKKTLGRLLDPLHDDIWDIFTQSVSSELLQRMGGTSHELSTPNQ